MIWTDESKLNWVDRLGLAYCRLNSWKWDDLLGPSPDGFSDMSKTEKMKYLQPAYKGIESIIGTANTSRCWWIFELGRTEEEWLRWYITEAFAEQDQKSNPKPTIMDRIKALLQKLKK